MRQILFVTLLLATFVAPSAGACTCIWRPLKYAFKSSTAMFTGVVMNVSYTKVTFQVTEPYKGPYLAGAKLVVFNTACGAYLERGGEYLVDASIDDNGSLRTSVCHYTRPLSSPGVERDLALLRSRASWWKSPLSYPGRFPLRLWYDRRIGYR